jgi:hypothetical protein
MPTFGVSTGAANVGVDGVAAAVSELIHATVDVADVRDKTVSPTRFSRKVTRRAAVLNGRRISTAGATSVPIK